MLRPARQSFHIDLKIVMAAIGAVLRGNDLVCAPMRGVAPALGPVLAFAIVIALLGHPAQAQPATSAERPEQDGDQISFAANDVDFLNLIGTLEAPLGFDAVSGFAPLPPPEPLTAMTLTAVIAYQDRIRAAGTVSSAVGRYQFIQPTLQALVRDHGISRDLIFDAEVQTYLARFLMRDCGFYDPDTPLAPLANCLATVWAALPMVTGPTYGRSFYDGDGINAALTHPDTVLTLLAQRFQW